MPDAFRYQQTEKLSSIAKLKTRLSAEMLNFVLVIMALGHFVAVEHTV